MLDRFFNLMKNSNLIGSLYYDLSHFFIIWQRLTFLGIACDGVYIGQYLPVSSSNMRMPSDQ